MSSTQHFALVLRRRCRRAMARKLAAIACYSAIIAVFVAVDILLLLPLLP